MKIIYICFKLYGNVPVSCNNGRAYKAFSLTGLYDIEPKSNTTFTRETQEFVSRVNPKVNEFFLNDVVYVSKLKFLTDATT